MDYNIYQWFIKYFGIKNEDDTFLKEFFSDVLVYDGKALECKEE